VLKLDPVITMLNAIGVLIAVPALGVREVATGVLAVVGVNVH